MSQWQEGFGTTSRKPPISVTRYAVFILILMQFLFPKQSRALMPVKTELLPSIIIFYNNLVVCASVQSNSHFSTL